VPIIEQLNSLKAPNKKETALHHLAERWRERLLTDETALNAFANEFPEADRALLDTQIQGAKEDKTRNRPPKNYRLLYAQIHQLVVAQSRTAT
jgi:ribosome-associated protein